VLSADGTLAFALAAGQFVLGDAGNVLTVDLSFMAALAEVGVSPAEPLGHLAAEAAFERNVLLAVPLAVCSLNWATSRTYQLFWIELFRPRPIPHRFRAAFPAAEVGLVTLETLEVGVDGHGVLLLVFIVRRRWILQYLIFVSFFMCQSFECLLFDLAEKRPECLNYLVEWRLLG
jgi:hypothetical protein